MGGGGGVVWLIGWGTRSRGRESLVDGWMDGFCQGLIDERCYGGGRDGVGRSGAG